MSEKEILKLCKVKKRIEKNHSDMCIDLKVMSGEIIGIVGITSSGKSLLANIMTGRTQSDGGEMFLCGERCSENELRTQTAYINGGDNIIDGISIAENLFLGEMHEFLKFFSVDRAQLFCRSSAALSRVGLFNVSPKTMAYTLSAGEKKLVELARCLVHSPRLIVLDEAFMAIDKSFRMRMTKILNGYSSAGGAVVFFSRDIKTERSICDRIFIMRDFKLDEACNDNDILYLDYEVYSRPKAVPDGCDMLLRAVNMCCGGLLNNINIKLCRGEFIGIVGLSQSGIHMLGEALFGARRLERGRISVKGRAIVSTKDAIKRKISYARSNFDYGKIIDILRGDSEIFILDSIFDGCTKDEIAMIGKLMGDICMRGGAVIFISEDISEHIRMCDEIIVIKDGVQVSKITCSDADCLMLQITEHMI